MMDERGLRTLTNLQTIAKNDRVVVRIGDIVAVAVGRQISRQGSVIPGQIAVEKVDDPVLVDVAAPGDE